MISHVHRNRLAAQTAEVLLQRIRAGEWPLGHRLPSEAALAVQLGVGRSTLREAVRELAGRGVLDSRQGAGVFVIAVDSTDDWDVVLRRADIVAVSEARMAIECEAAARAAARRTSDDLRSIRRTLAGRAVEDIPVTEHIDADIAFHRAVVAAAHNDVLTQIFDAFVPRVRAAFLDMVKIRPSLTASADHAEHCELADAIAARNPAAAAFASRSHLTALMALFT